MDFEGNLSGIWLCPPKAFTNEPVRPPGMSGAPRPHLLIDPVALSVRDQQQCCREPRGWTTKQSARVLDKARPSSACEYSHLQETAPGYHWVPVGTEWLTGTSVDCSPELSALWTGCDLPHPPKKSGLLGCKVLPHGDGA